VRRCQEEIKKRLAEMERQGAITTVESLKKQRQDLAARQARLLNAVEMGGGDLGSLIERVRKVEDEIRRTDAAIAVHRPVKPDLALDEIREHVVKSFMRLGETLKAGDISRTKEAVAKHIGKLVLAPVQRDGRPAYKVSGNVSAQPDTDKCRMQLVARDGIGWHYTVLTLPVAGVALNPRA